MATKEKVLEKTGKKRGGMRRNIIILLALILVIGIATGRIKFGGGKKS